MSDVLTGVNVDYGFIFEAAEAGIVLQNRIDGILSNSLQAFEAGVASLEERGGIVHEKIQDGIARDNDGQALVDNAIASSYDSVQVAVEARALQRELSGIESDIMARIGGTAVCAKVIPGVDRKLIARTYESTGLAGSQQQEVNSRHRNKQGFVVAAHIGHNALILMPPAGKGDRLNTGVYIVPLIRNGGNPNVELIGREPGIRDRVGFLSRRMYEGHGFVDGSTDRIVELATRIGAIRQPAMIANQASAL